MAKNQEVSTVQADQAEEQYVTIFDVAKQQGFTKAKVRTAFANHPVFAGKVRERPIPGTDYAPIKEAPVSVVNEWLEALKQGTRTGSTSRVNADGKKYIVRLPVADADGKSATLILDGISYDVTVVQAFQRKKSAKSAAAQAAEANPASATPLEQVTIDALEAEAAPVSA